MSPKIVFIGQDDLRIENLSYFRDGFLLYLKETYQCKTIVFDKAWQFLENIEDIRFLYRKKEIAFFLVMQESYDNDHYVTIRKIKEIISLQAPVILLKNLRSRKKPKKSYYYDDKRLHLKIEKLLKKNEPCLDYFGCKNKKELAITISNLEKLYEIHQENHLSLSSYNDGIVAEALRLRLLSPELFKQEFDEKLGEARLEKKTNFLSKIDVKKLKEECRRIKMMPEDERQKFCWDIESLLQFGMCGQDASGFAIDSLTFEYSISSGFGNHQLARLDLNKRIEQLERIKTSRGFDIEMDISRMAFFVEGLIFKNVLSFFSRILRLNTYDISDKFIQIGSFMKIEKGLITINLKGEPLFY